LKVAGELREAPVPDESIVELLRETLDPERLYL
jgi:hypothetical protein